MEIKKSVHIVDADSWAAVVFPTDQVDGVLATMLTPHAPITLIDAQIMDICKRLWNVMKSAEET